VYPNPTKGYVTVAVGNRNLIGTKATLVDQNGKLLQWITITAANQPVNLSAYTNGIYYINLNNKEVLRVMKQ
jgi:hypothetical protein